MTKTVTTSEANIQRAVCDLLDAKRIFWCRMNAGDRFGSYTSKKTGKAKSWRIKGQKEGTADLLALPMRAPWLVTDGNKFWHKYNGHVLWIETKPTGGTQSPAQIDFQQDVEARGMTYLLVDNIDTLIEWFKNRSL